ncbi:hypothetical protein CEUSTIGMA_g5265.t1 [Chlamydomonas eustigma]|uniref:Uncharacterized protein n=1 Tax=Chlamydomonas eustigma TaxID=1157962 RepID=A0A250X4K2_9CHLO|nr:hypothetical protein CEUSTIGMA_g5265.t1 [Chlamydomonas eustigma]|eukprot:GAX77822.1 hypothetical protein CEUSTIGMA_g5265.t1 [Chlamydomonas eustigma]
MVRIDNKTRSGIVGQETFGPLAVLLVGFLWTDFDRFLTLMEEMEADQVKVVPCTTAMLSGTLQDALEVEPIPHYQQPALGQRRALILSGMYGSEVVEMVASYKEAGLPPCVFAAAVPNNYQRKVVDLVKEVYADHEAMTKRKQSAQ